MRLREDHPVHTIKKSVYKKNLRSDSSKFTVWKGFDLNAVVPTPIASIEDSHFPQNGNDGKNFPNNKFLISIKKIEGHYNWCTCSFRNSI